MLTTMNSTHPLVGNQSISLTAAQMDCIVGGDGKAAQTTSAFLRYDFALVAVKTISWSSTDD